MQKQVTVPYRSLVLMWLAIGLLATGAVMLTVVNFSQYQTIGRLKADATEPVEGLVLKPVTEVGLITADRPDGAGVELFREAEVGRFRVCPVIEGSQILDVNGHSIAKVKFPHPW